MSTHRIAVIAAFLLAMAIAGCSHNAPAPPTATPQAGEASSLIPIASPTSPDGIMALSKRLTAHRRALFSVTQGKYSYYAGESLIAEYEVATEILRISSLAPGQSDTSCVYSPHGVLYVDPKAHPDGKAFTANCDQLVMTLNDDLSR
jgi:hypothetical protein